MKKLLKRNIALVLAIMMTFGSGEYGAIFTSNVFAEEVTSGTCGENLTWNFDGSTGTLSISGTGKMYNFHTVNNIVEPWSNYKTLIKSVNISEGVKSIGMSAFLNCIRLANVNIACTVTEIGYGAFKNCHNLREVIIPNGVEHIYGSTFSDCKSLTNITIPNSVIDISYTAFASCEELRSIIIPSSVISIGSYAFSSCNNLKKIQISNPYCAFENNALPYSIKDVYGYENSTAQRYAINHNKNFYNLNNNCFEHNYISTVIKPTQTKQGYTLHKCSVCGDSYKDNFTDRLSNAKRITTFTKVSFTLKSSKKKVNLKWKKVKGAKGYIVYYKKSKKSSWKKLKTLSSKKTSFVKKGLKKGKTYYFTVKAYKVIKGKKVYGKFVTEKVKVK